jgi:alkylated DNA repair protein alkB family protein 6
VIYLPDFFSEEQGRSLLEQVHCSAAHDAWVQLKSRRLQLWQDTSTSTSTTTTARPAAGLPPWLDRVIDTLVDAGLFPDTSRPDHCLLNEYAADEGILPHTDGPRFHPRVATVSLGSSAVMSFRRALSTDEIGPDTATAPPAMSLILRPRSLVLFFGEAYTMLHSIEPGPHNTVPPPPGECGPGHEVGRLYGPCVNLDPAAAVAGETIARGPRVSLTFRREVAA